MKFAWSEYLTVLSLSLLAVALFGVSGAGEASVAVQRGGTLAFDQPFVVGGASETGGNTLVTSRSERRTPNAREARLMSDFEEGWSELSTRPSSKLKRDSFMALDLLFLQTGRYHEYAEILETLYVQGRLLRAIARMVPRPASGKVREHARNLADLLPFLARARWNLGSAQGALEIAERSVMELPSNADAFMVLALVRAQIGPETRLEVLGLRNLLARVIQIDPAYQDPGFKVDASAIREQLVLLDEKVLRGFTVDPVPGTRAEVAVAVSQARKRLALVEGPFVVIERLRARFLR